MSFMNALMTYEPQHIGEASAIIVRACDTIDKFRHKVRGWREKLCDPIESQVVWFISETGNYEIASICRHRYTCRKTEKLNIVISSQEYEYIVPCI